jgi:hypothetical protein
MLLVAGVDGQFLAHDPAPDLLTHELARHRVAGPAEPDRLIIADQA